MAPFWLVKLRGHAPPPILPISSTMREVPLTITQAPPKGSARKRTKSLPRRVPKIYDPEVTNGKILVGVENPSQPADIERALTAEAAMP